MQFSQGRRRISIYVLWSTAANYLGHSYNYPIGFELICPISLKMD